VNGVGLLRGDASRQRKQRRGDRKREGHRAEIIVSKDMHGNTKSRKSQAPFDFFFVFSHFRAGLLSPGRPEGCYVVEGNESGRAGAIRRARRAND
jgi:hypothetical protein